VSERSHIKKRSDRIGGHKTSLTVEDEFWESFKEIARERQLPLNNLLADINKQRAHANFSSVIRLFVLNHYVTLTKLKAK
jgi:predicted DNA-binding ribbon-helix-helix protein